MSAADKKKSDRRGTVYNHSLSTGWTDTSPHTQSTMLNGITSADNILVSLNMPDNMNLNADTEKAMQKAFSLISNVTTGDGYITFKCISGKPDIEMFLLITIL